MSVNVSVRTSFLEIRAISDFNWLAKVLIRLSGCRLCCSKNRFVLPDANLAGFAAARYAVGHYPFLKPPQGSKTNRRTDASDIS